MNRNLVQVGLAHITCSGRIQPGSSCVGGTAKVYAIVTSVVHHPRSPLPRTDITSSITIINVNNDIKVRCENQIDERLRSEILHVSSMFNFLAFLSDIDKHKRFLGFLAWTVYRQNFICKVSRALWLCSSG